MNVLVEHLVLFKPIAGITEEQKTEFVTALRELQSIDGIVELSAGWNHSQEGKSQGFEIGLRITFRDQAALDAYIPCEAHRNAVARIRPLFEDVIVVDYNIG